MRTRGRQARLSVSCPKAGRSFTMIELLVVMAIISMLTAMLLPAVSSVREKARQIKCASNLRQIGLAFRMYADEHGDYFPDAWDGTNRWHDKILPYLSSTNITGGKQVLYCPSSDGTAAADYNVYKKNQWGPKLSVQYDSQIVVVFDGIYDAGSAAADNNDYFLYVTNRHNGTANFLFGDMHVAPMENTTPTNWVILN